MFLVSLLNRAGAYYGLFAAVLLLLILAEYLFPFRRTPLFRQGWLIDLAYILYGLLVGPVLANHLVRPLYIAIYPALGLLADFHALVRSQPFILQAFEALLIVDLNYYWAHRLLHRQPFWRSHIIHHGAKDIDAVSGGRNHPFDALPRRISLLCLTLLMGFVPQAMLLSLPASVFFTFSNHANLPISFGPLRYLFVSPDFHRWHHAVVRGAKPVNFGGVFAFWDYLFGTAYHPVKGEACIIDTSIYTPQSLWAQLVFPLWATSGPGDTPAAPASRSRG